MTLGEIVKEYREKHNISQRRFAELSGLSNSYISQLEQNINSKNGQPITPSLVAIKQVADAMNVPLDSVLARLDDIMIDISKKPIAGEGDELDAKIMLLIQKLPVSLKLSLVDLLQAAVEGVRKK